LKMPRSRAFASLSAVMSDTCQSDRWTRRAEAWRSIDE
jgi:hypothetical protein